MQEHYIDTEPQLEQFCERVRHSPWLALDTEFVREKNYYPRFCLLQISNGDEAACIDPLRIADLTHLRRLLFDPETVKVFHAGRQDLEIFYYLWKSLPAPLFDTQLAATLLGMGDQVGYANLVKTILGDELEKAHTRTDWSQRPLNDAQIRYALDDVVYLGEIYHLLHQQLQQQGRLSWLKEDFAELADPATYAIAPESAWQRVKGRQHLHGKQLAVLQQLAAWRETQAQKSDRPRRWIMKDDILIDLARRTPRSLEKLQQIRGIDASLAKRRGEQMLALIEQGLALPKADWPKEKRTGPKLTPNQEAQADLLMAALRLQAEANQITYTALGSRKEIERLVAGERELELLHGWRKALTGDLLLAVLDGEMQLFLTEGKLQLQAA